MALSTNYNNVNKALSYISNNFNNPNYKEIDELIVPQSHPDFRRTSLGFDD